MKKLTKQAKAQAIAAAIERNSKRSFNPHAMVHLGYIHCDGSETPVGINTFGIGFEDANYALADNWSCRKYGKWQTEVLNELRDGMASGIACGLAWKFVSETATTNCQSNIYAS